MKLLQTRLIYNDDSTVSVLEVIQNNIRKFNCYILEDRVREEGLKIYGRTAIPAGTYKIEISHSPRYNRLMPRLLDVPMFDGILMHWGNDDKDTDGCLLTGESVYNNNYLYYSRRAWEVVFKMLWTEQELKKENLITIVDTIDIKGRL